jgi:hypothetical protein
MSWSLSDLTTKVGQWLGRSNLSAQIADAILLFESDYNTRKGVYRAQADAVLTTTIGSDTLSLPDDYEGMVALVRAGYPGRIQVVSLARLNQERAGATGEPTFAAVYPGGKLKFDVEADAAYDYELVYHKRLDPLGGETTSNWLLENYPHAYLFGVLFYMLEYVQDAERANRIVSKHEANMAALESGDWEKLLPVQDAALQPETSAP